jgi:hypothetical protein
VITEMEDGRSKFGRFLKKRHINPLVEGRNANLKEFNKVW